MRKWRDCVVQRASSSEHRPASSVLAPYPAGIPPALGMPGYKASFVQIGRTRPELLGLEYMMRKGTEAGRYRKPRASYVGPT